MSGNPPNQPTELELEILKVLWQDAPLPVREVRERLESGAGRKLAHTSVITILNIMHRKKLVRRRKAGKSFLFSPRVEREQVIAGVMSDLLTRVFEGSASAMMLSLIDSAEVDSKELAELRKLINRKSRDRNQ